MSDPKRLSDPAGEGTQEERELIATARAHGMPTAVKAAVWSAVVVQGAGAVATAQAAAAAGSAAKGTVLAGLSSWKGIAILAVVGAGAVTGAGLLHQRGSSSSPPPAHVAPAVARPVPVATEHAPSLAPVPSPAAVEPLPRTTARSLERSRPGRAAEEPLPSSRLAEEAQSLVEARRLLRSGAVAAAISALESANREFAGGRLAQEREALLIDALAQSGQRDPARHRAEAFLRDYPRSPHAADVKRHVEDK